MATALSELRENGFRGSGVRGPGRIGLTRMDLFAGLPERDLTLLDSRLPLVRWPRGAAMPEPLGRSDHLFVVRDGRLAMFESTAPGHEIMISLLDAGAIYVSFFTERYKDDGSAEVLVYDFAKHQVRQYFIFIIKVQLTYLYRFPHGASTFAD